MTRAYKFISYLLLYTLISCNESNTVSISPKDDTTRVIELALRTAFYHHNLPSIDPLSYPYHFKDSILFTSDNLPLHFLPQTLDSLNFKILSLDKICPMILADSKMEKTPNYLIVRNLEKSDTGYYVHLGSLSCRPYGGGGSIGIYIEKKKDSFIVKSKMSSSIN